jgi:hypothetical protein
VPSGVASAPAQRLTAIQDPKDFIERLSQLDDCLTRGDICESVAWPESGADSDHTFPQGCTLCIAKLRGPSPIRQESFSGALVNKLIQDALEQLSGAESRLVERWIGVARKKRLGHRYSSEWIGSPFKARVR